VPGLGTSFGRGGATTFVQDLVNSDCILIEGSNFAECHPVAFRFVMEAKERGATIIHVDPRFTRTSAVADVYAPIRSGTDIVFLGALISWMLKTSATSKSTCSRTPTRRISCAKISDTEDLDGLFSGWQSAGSDAAKDTHAAASAGLMGDDENPRRRAPTTATWQFEPKRCRASTATGHGRVPKRDETLQHPRCVINVLRATSRATRPRWSKTCAARRATFVEDREPARRQQRPRAHDGVRLRRRLDAAHGRRAVHPHRAILQMLLGNMGRPGGGIMALRGHANIQGATDIPTLYDLLPGLSADALGAARRANARATT
jgi:formate dehydrogenase major subunit